MPTHRDVIEADGTYSPRERPGSYARHFADEIESLSTKTLTWGETSKALELSVVPLAT